MLITFRGHYLSKILRTLTFGQNVSKMSSSKKAVQTFGEHLRTIRESAGLSLKVVATEIGIDLSLLGKLERNERPPTKEQIKQLAIFFKIDKHQLTKEFLSDYFAYKILDEEADLDTLRVAEEKVKYIKKNKKK